MKKIFCILLVLSISFYVFSQNEVDNSILSDLYYADVPIKEGVDDFEAKLDFIRQSENREPLGLVLCGGSARAFAHIGVLKSLEENGITPDFIVANSMGAIIGMLYSYGFSPDTISQVIEKIDLTSFFDPVVPIHGGVINTRKFRALINEILGQESVDISDCEIPIIVLTEDLITKRQIWHCTGDFATIMSAAFSMPGIMETVTCNLVENNQIEVCLTDSGSVDIAGISVAENFSQNIVVSTAFYDKEINLNNFVVVINRVMAIGKERQTIEDIKEYQPLIIKNEVENFSFMEFDKVKELEKIGYESTEKVIDSIKNLPYGYKDLSDKRQKTKENAKLICSKIDNQIPIESTENYFGGKIRLSFADIDYPDFSLYENNGVSFVFFGGTQRFYGRFGFLLPFSGGVPTPELYLRYNPFKKVGLTLFSTYGDDFFAAGKLDVSKLVFTAELKADKNLVPKDILFTLGPNLSVGQEKGTFFKVKPLVFSSGEKIENLSYGIGSLLNFQLVSNNFGFANNFSIRYALKDGVTKLYKSDYFRDEKSPLKNNLVYSNGFEFFYLNSKSQFSFAELFIIKAIKLGGFFDLSYVTDCDLCVGGFGRINLSFIGLCDFILESGVGYNLSNQNVFGYFTLKNRI